MHADEVEVGPDLARRLLAGQFPAWADRTLTRVPSAGTDNAIYRLGTDLALRLPRYPSAARQVEKERRWLPLLAPHLPYAVPVPVAAGTSTAEYPFPWQVCRWVDGGNPPPDQDDDDLARDLAAFVTALRAVDPTGGPPPGDHNFGRGRPLADRDGYVREALAATTDLVDTAAATRAWEEALAAPPWDGPPVWVHGDLAPGNVLVRHGHLSGVVDFGGLGVGDPATDLLPAWNLLAGRARATFRDVVGVDDATWERGRGWALSVALIQLPYYRHTSERIVAGSLHDIAAVLGT